MHFAAMFFMGPVAAVAILGLREVHLVARSPIWLIPVILVAGQLLTTASGFWWDGSPQSRVRLHARIGSQAALVTAVIYATGWGPALAIGLVLVGHEALVITGSSSQRVVLGWNLSCLAAGQGLIALGWAPSLIPAPEVHGLAVLVAIGITFSYRSLHTALIEKEVAAARHRAVVENAAEGILTVGLDGTIGSFNAAAEAMFGWTATEVVGLPIATLFPTAQADALAAFSAGAGALGRSNAQRHDVETAGVRRDRTEFPMMVSTSAIRVEGSAPIISAIVRDLSDQKRFEAQLAHQAMHDPLTGLPNRAMLTDRLDRALARVRRQDRMCAVLYVDLDRFKAVNDTLGHAVGDQLLVEAAARIQAAVRETDTVARLGGDEFVVLCEDIEGVHYATHFAQRIIAALQIPFRFGDDDPHVSATIGIAFSVDGTETADAILANADIAMYRAKDNGRSCYELFDEDMQQWVAAQGALETALRQAVPRDELRLYCQPIIETDTRNVSGFEALVRWERPGFGLVAPGSFIPTAEETGLIVDIGNWVLDRACRHAASWATRWPGWRLGISVNVSSRQLLTDDILEVVTGVLARTGLDPTLLTLELTESILIDDTLTVEPLLRELRALGVSLALDDFGTGYSSLTYLRAFPINIVKIDQSFIRAIGTEQEDTAIVAAVIALGKNLGLNVIAEGIETEEQLAALRQLGCPYMQGYLFSHPTPIDQVATVLEPATLGPAADESTPTASAARAFDNHRRGADLRTAHNADMHS
ncbi:MAG: putative bifunctional diguanylate cyclase/phosphodiesterase [Acidimicrobiia bacterium]